MSSRRRQQASREGSKGAVDEEPSPTDDGVSPESGAGGSPAEAPGPNPGRRQGAARDRAPTVGGPRGRQLQQQQQQHPSGDDDPASDQSKGEGDASGGGDDISNRGSRSDNEESNESSIFDSSSSSSSSSSGSEDDEDDEDYGARAPRRSGLSFQKSKHQPAKAIGKETQEKQLPPPRTRQPDKPAASGGGGAGKSGQGGKPPAGAAPARQQRGATGAGAGTRTGAGGASGHARKRSTSAPLPGAVPEDAAGTDVWPGGGLFPAPPTSVTIQRRGGDPLVIPSTAFGDIMSAYNVLRVFTWQLRLSPFSIEDLCAALAADHPTPLCNELYVCLLRALAMHETSADRRRRRLDLSLLDSATWPEFVWDWLALMRDRGLLALHYAKSSGRGGGTAVQDGEEEPAGCAHVAAEVEAAVQDAVKRFAGQRRRGGEAAGRAGGGAGGSVKRAGRKRAAPKRVEEAAIVWTDDEDEGHPVARRRGLHRKRAPAPQQHARGAPSSAAVSRGQSEEPAEEAGAEGAAPAKGEGGGSQGDSKVEGKPPVATKEEERIEDVADAGGGAGAEVGDGAGADDGQDAPSAKRVKLEGSGSVAGAGATGAAAAALRGAAPPPSPPERPKRPAARRENLPPQLLALRSARPAPQVGRVDYWSLSVCARAAILARMCDDLLNCGLARSELDKREGAGLWHAGKGGAGGAFEMLTEEQKLEKAERQEQDKSKETVAIHLENPDTFDDGNADTCMVCGVGGSLLCCDTCPAAYHSKCMGLNPRELPPKWVCPECAIGGRGEAAGLRAPIAGVDDGAGAVVWAAYGRLFAAYPRGPLESGGGRDRWGGAAPATAAARGGSKNRRKPGQARVARGRGAGAGHPVLPDAGEAGLVMLTGKEAAVKLTQIRKQAAAAPPHPTAFEAVQEAAKQPPAEADPERYVNLYCHAWPMAAAALKSWIEEQSKRKRAGLGALPAALPVPDFTWPGEREGRPAVAAMMRNHLVREAGDLWGLLEGDWAGPGAGVGGICAFRRWRERVQAASTLQDLASLAVELESSVRRSLGVMEPHWDPSLRRATSTALTAAGSLGGACTLAGAADAAAEAAADAGPPAPLVLPPLTAHSLQSLPPQVVHAAHRGGLPAAAVITAAVGGLPDVKPLPLGAPAAALLAQAVAAAAAAAYCQPGALAEAIAEAVATVSPQGAPFQAAEQETAAAADLGQLADHHQQANINQAGLATDGAAAAHAPASGTAPPQPGGASKSLAAPQPAYHLPPGFVTSKEQVVVPTDDDSLALMDQQATTSAAAAAAAALTAGLAMHALASRPLPKRRQSERPPATAAAAAAAAPAADKAEAVVATGAEGAAVDEGEQMFDINGRPLRGAKKRAQARIAGQLVDPEPEWLRQRPTQQQRRSLRASGATRKNYADMEGSDGDDDDDDGASGSESDEDAWQEDDGDVAAPCTLSRGAAATGTAAAMAPAAGAPALASAPGRSRPRPGRTPTPAPASGAFAVLAVQRRPPEPLPLQEISGWRWLRTLRERAEGVLTLPPQMALRLARRGGLVAPGPGARFKKREPHAPILTRRLRWVSATLRVRSAPALALQLRQLHGVVRWDAVRRPPPGAPPLPPPVVGSAAATEAAVAAAAAEAAGVPPLESPQWQGAAVRGRRSARPRVGYEYLVGVPLRVAGGALGAGHHHLSRSGRTVQDEPAIGSMLVSFLWVHEHLMPLWLVKGYEEAVRRSQLEAAALAAAAEAEADEAEAMAAALKAEAAAAKAARLAEAPTSPAAAAAAEAAATAPQAPVAEPAEADEAAVGRQASPAAAEAPAVHTASDTVIEEPAKATTAAASGGIVQPAAVESDGAAAAAPLAPGAEPVDALQAAAAVPPQAVAEDGNVGVAPAASGGPKADEVPPAAAAEARAARAPAAPPHPQRPTPPPGDPSTAAAAEAAVAAQEAAAAAARASNSRNRAEAAGEALREGEALMSGGVGVHIQCGGCCQSGGDSSPNDLLWVMCGCCSRWYHASCEGLGPDASDSLADPEGYVCTICQHVRAGKRRSRRAEVATAASADPVSATAAAISAAAAAVPRMFQRKWGRPGRPAKSMLAAVEADEAVEAVEDAAQQLRREGRDIPPEVAAQLAAARHLADLAVQAAEAVYAAKTGGPVPGAGGATPARGPVGRPRGRGGGTGRGGRRRRNRDEEEDNDEDGGEEASEDDDEGSPEPLDENDEEFKVGKGGPKRAGGAAAAGRKSCSGGGRRPHLPVAGQRGRGSGRKGGATRVHEEDDEEEERAPRLPGVLLCLCRRPDDRRDDYVQCDGCDNWFHPDCLGLTPDELDMIDPFFCPSCITRVGLEWYRSNPPPAVTAAIAAAPTASPAPSPSGGLQPGAVRGGPQDGAGSRDLGGSAASCGSQSWGQAIMAAVGLQAPCGGTAAAAGGLGTGAPGLFAAGLGSQGGLGGQGAGGLGAPGATVDGGFGSFGGPHPGAASGQPWELLQQLQQQAAGAAAAAAGGSALQQQQQQQEFPGGFGGAWGHHQQQVQQQPQQVLWQMGGQAAGEAAAQQEAYFPGFAPRPIRTIPCATAAPGQPSQGAQLALSRGGGLPVAAVALDGGEAGGHFGALGAQRLPSGALLGQKRQLSGGWGFTPGSAAGPLGGAAAAGGDHDEGGLRKRPRPDYTEMERTGYEGEAAAPLQQAQQQQQQQQQQRQVSEVAEWLPRAARVIKYVFDLPCGQPFSVPVPKEETVYHEVIERPMDLGTVLRKIARGKYSSPEQVVSDVALVWSNCFEFNEEDAIFYRQAQEAKAAFDQRWAAAGLPPAAPPHRHGAGGGTASGGHGIGGGVGGRGSRGRKARAPGIYAEADSDEDDYYYGPGIGGGQQRERHGGEGGSGGGRGGNGGGGGLFGRGSSRAPAPITDPQQQMHAALEVLRHVMNLRSSQPFREPVDSADVPDYYEVVRAPMDLGTIQSRLMGGHYYGLEPLWSDIEQVWTNCRLYNKPNSEVGRAGNATANALRQRWKAAGLPGMPTAL